MGQRHGIVAIDKDCHDRMEGREGKMIKAIWSHEGDWYVYEGCLVLLEDGQMCALSVARRTQENRIREISSSLHLHNRFSHACCKEGQGIPLYGFQIRIKDRYDFIGMGAGRHQFKLLRCNRWVFTRAPCPNGGRSRNCSAKLLIWNGE